MKKNTVRTGTFVAAGGALTASYVTQGSIISCSGFDQLVVLVNFTKGDETSLDFKIQVSDTPAFTVAYERTYLDTDATGISTVLPQSYTMTATGTRMILIDLSMPYLRFQAKATGGTPTGTIGALYRLDNNER